MSYTQLERVLILILLCSLAASCSRSAVNSTQPNDANPNEPPRIASVDVVEATPQEATLTRGESGDALVPIKITSGYHVNANPPSYPYLKATEIELQPAAGISVEFITYPDPLTRKFSFAENPLAVYEGETMVKVRLKADKSAVAGKHNLSAKLRVQACDDKVCYAPGEKGLIIPVNIK
jgi:thiol:disulfide interchange protein DsbD